MINDLNNLRLYVIILGIIYFISIYLVGILLEKTTTNDKKKYRVTKLNSMTIYTCTNT